MNSFENRLPSFEQPAQAGEQGVGERGNGSVWKGKARAFWAERYGRPVSEAQVEEIHRNLYGFFCILKQWKEEDARRPSDGAGPGEVAPK